MSSTCAPEQPTMLAIKLLTWDKQKCWEMNKKNPFGGTYFSREIIIFNPVVLNTPHISTFSFTQKAFQHFLQCLLLHIKGVELEKIHMGWIVNMWNNKQQLFEINYYPLLNGNVTVIFPTAYF